MLLVDNNEEDKSDILIYEVDINTEFVLDNHQSKVRDVNMQHLQYMTINIWKLIVCQQHFATTLIVCVLRYNQRTV